MNNQRIIFYTLSHRSGMGRVATELVLGAERAGCGPITLIAPPMEHEPGGVGRVVLPLTSTSHSRFVKLASMAWMSVVGIVATLRQARPGTVFVMVELGSTMPISVLPALAARARGAITVLNLHDFYPHALRSPTPMHGVERALYRWCYRRFAVIAAMKPAQRDRLRDEARIAPDRVVVIELGPFVIDAITPPSAADGPVRLLVLGSLRRNKRVLESIRALAQLQADGYPATLRIAGAPLHQQRDYWAQCQADLARLNGAEVFDRYIRDEELPAMLSNVDALLCPYEGFDSQSGVSIVAVSNGLPLIATAAAAVPGCDQGLFRVAAPVTEGSIIEAIRGFLAQPRAQRLASAAQARAALEGLKLWEEAAARIVATATRSEAAKGTQPGKWFR